jgi:hypothetical protein
MSRYLSKQGQLHASNGKTQIEDMQSAKAAEKGRTEHIASDWHQPNIVNIFAYCVRIHKLLETKDNPAFCAYEPK